MISDTASSADGLLTITTSYAAIAATVVVAILLALVLRRILGGAPNTVASGDKKPAFITDAASKLGLSALPAVAATALVAIWLLLTTAFILGLLYVLGSLVYYGRAELTSEPGNLRWYLLTLTAMTAALSAVIALPFTLLRTGFTARQTRTAEENLTTDLINKAVEGLGAQKEVNRLGRNVHWVKDGQTHTRFEWMDAPRDPPDHERPGKDDKTTLTRDVWAPIAETRANIEVRVGAVLSLERMARARAETGTDGGARDHIRVMEILCAYIRENAPADLASDHGLADLPERDSRDKEATEAREHRCDAIGAWAAKLKPPRTDIRTAIEVIGRRSAAQAAIERTQPQRRGSEGYRLDLRSTCFQGADLSALDLSHALLTSARLEGADLSEARLEGADLSGARLEGADLNWARLEGADLNWARLEGADLRDARLEAADLIEARLEGADLRGARLEGADLREARLEAADLSLARLEGAGLGEARLEGADLRQARLEGADLREARLEAADLSLARLEGADLREARLEAADLSLARLEGASLWDARLEGADLRGARLDATTTFRPATLRGAGLKVVVLTDQDVNPDLLAEAFGDASVALPAGLVAGKGKLAHWSKEDLDFDDFFDKWRAHQASIGYVPPVR